MNVNQLMIESLQLLALGMGAVFIILISLIVIISVVARVLPEEATVAFAKPASGINPDHVAAIGAAIQQYRKNRN